jgi:hypothetical protein
MKTVFLPPGSASLTRDLMSSVPERIHNPLATPVTVANADQLGERPAVPQQKRDIEVTAGWDAYEVWRRFIKDPRDRRQQPE